MKKTINILLIITLFFINSISFAEESSNNDNNLNFKTKTKTYTEPYSNSVITIPEDWVINETNEEPLPNTSKSVSFIAPNKNINISFLVADLYCDLNFVQKLFVDRKNKKINEDTYDGMKKEFESEGKTKVSEIILNGEKYLRTISNEKYPIDEGNNSGSNKEGNKIFIIKIKNFYIYQFSATTDVNSNEYKDFEKVVANTVYLEPTNK